MRHRAAVLGSRRARAVVLAAVLALGTPSSAPAYDDGLFTITLPDGLVLTTHGPDSLHATRPGYDRDAGQRAPVCASDFYVRVLYARAEANARRAGAVRDIQAAVRRANYMLYADARASGARGADLKVACDATGAIDVAEFVVDETYRSYYGVSATARAAGHTLPNVHYLVFADFRAGCGQASMHVDESPGPANLNSLGGGYAVVWASCWHTRAPLHELGHVMGAVQDNAPHSTGGGHCYEHSDVMCYTPDGGGKNQDMYVVRCRDRVYFDCGFDDYFDAAPEPGEYLANHWNIGSPANRFLVLTR